MDWKEITHESHVTFLKADILAVIDHHREIYSADPPRHYLLRELRGGWYARGVLKRTWRIPSRVGIETLAVALGFIAYHDEHRPRTIRIGLAEDHNLKSLSLTYRTLNEMGDSLELEEDEE